jgi:hypothetical protein
VLLELFGGTNVKENHGPPFFKPKGYRPLSNPLLHKYRDTTLYVVNE